MRERNLIDDADRERRRIERELEYSVADAELQMGSTFRLWSLAALAALMALSMLLSAEAITAAEVIRVLALVAGASAAFHAATWALLRIWLRLAHGR